ncbi:unnamed protein product [Brassicogethes aeneus]|uniref:Cuticle protein n=1 Tax=Brassicogethes aeneus TaxID=1431903 RepID=A0A9P0AWY9_BRAAE|nr:unnamed protein product [Brassicogethes aeneus]
MAFKFVVFAAFVAVARAGGLVAPTYSSYAAPAVVSHGYAAPVYAHATPVVAKYSAAPAVATSYSSIAHSAPVVSKYAAAPVYTQSYAAPAYSHGYATPAVAAYAAPVAKVAYAPIQKTIVAEAPANYEFGYSVNDPHTGDSKSAQETRHGDSVQGSYSLIDADGTKRTVEYTADEHNGFNAVVHKEPAQVAIKSVAKVAVATPVSYAAPVAHYAHAAPVVAKYAAAPALATSYSTVAHAAPAYAHYAQAAPVAQFAAAPAAHSYYH